MRGYAARVALAASLASGCATQGDGNGVHGEPDATDASSPDDRAGPSPDAIVLSIDGAADDAGATDATVGGKSCQGLPDGTACGPTPDACHDAPACLQGSCGQPPAKADGFICAVAPDACHDAATCTAGSCGVAPAKANATVCAMASDPCHTDGTCSAGTCGPVGNRPDGYNWSPGDATAICCGTKEVHASTSADCGACGIACNAGNGESCQILGGHYFCRGCVASAACWSHCCSTSFSPYSCAASDCAGNCDATDCPAGTHCVSGGTTSSDYCSY